MRLVLQRVISANVKVSNEIVGEISRGLLLFLAVEKNDEEKDANFLVDKILKLRIFPSNKEASSFMEKNIQDVGGSVLVVPQFTLYGECMKGTRPSFTKSAPPEKAEKLYKYFVEKISKKITTQTGQFGAHMNVSLQNDGPITLIIDSR